MLFLTSVASVCLRLRTISTARLTAATSIAAAVTMVLAGAGSRRLPAAGAGGSAAPRHRPSAASAAARGDRRASAAGGLGGRGPCGGFGSASLRPFSSGFRLARLLGLGSPCRLLVSASAVGLVGLGLASAFVLAAALSLPVLPVSAWPAADARGASAARHAASCRGRREQASLPRRAATAPKCRSSSASRRSQRTFPSAVRFSICRR